MFPIPKKGLQFEQTNKTGYDESRIMHQVCPICHLRYTRPPSHIARVKGTSTCSRACAAEARKVRVESHCVECGKSMELIPSNVPKITTCSKQCSTLRRVKDPSKQKKTNFGAYGKAAKNIALRGRCACCGTDCGSWVVKGLDAKMDNCGNVLVDESKAQLWCKRCHLKDVAKYGAPARMKNKDRSWREHERPN